MTSANLRRRTTQLILLLLSVLAQSAAANSLIEQDVNYRVDNLLNVEVKAIPMTEHVFKIDGQSGIFLVNTSEGSVLIDTGFPNESVVKQKKIIDELATGPIKKIILTHFHSDHLGGLPLWEDEIRGDAELIAHQRYNYMLKMQRDTVPYFKHRYHALYPESVDMSTMSAPDYWYWEPERKVYVGNDYEFELGGVQFRVIAFNNGGEGEDTVVVWLPQSEILLVGDLFGPLYPMFPNLYTVRGEKYRDALDYIDAMNQVLALNPQQIGASHTPVLNDQKYIQESVTQMRDAVQFVYDSTIEAMNSGKTVWQAMEDIKLPAELSLSQGHGKVSWSVRAIWETIAGWYHYDTVANLYSVSADAIDSDIVELAGGPGAIVDRARSYVDRGNLPAALRLLNIVNDTGDRAALRLRIAVLSDMVKAARKGANNYSEVGLLNADLADTRKRLDALGSGI